MLGSAAALMRKLARVPETSLQGTCQQYSVVRRVPSGIFTVLRP
jgi:hypothetical protein